MSNASLRLAFAGETMFATRTPLHAHGSEIDP
jgi:hypothetical protein